MRGLQPIVTFADATSNIAAMNILQAELSLMNAAYSDEHLIMLHSAKLEDSEKFKLLRKQFLLSDHHLHLASAPDVKLGLSPAKPPPPKHTWAHYCIEVEAWLRLETPVVSSLTVDNTATQSVVNAAMESPQKSESFSTERALNKVLELLTKIHTPPKSEQNFRQRRREQKEGWRDFREKREDRERRHGEGFQGRSKGRDGQQGATSSRDDRATSSSSSRGDRHRRNDTRDRTHSDQRDGRKRAYASVADREKNEESENSDYSKSARYIEHPDHDYVAMSAKGKVPADYDSTSSDDERR